MYIYLSIYLYLSIYIYIYLSISISIYLYLYLSLSLSLSIYLYLYLSLSLSLSLSIYPSIHPSIHLSIYLCVCVMIYVFVYEKRTIALLLRHHRAPERSCRVVRSPKSRANIMIMLRHDRQEENKPENLTNHLVSWDTYGKSSFLTGKLPARPWWCVQSLQSINFTLASGNCSASRKTWTDHVQRGEKFAKRPYYRFYLNMSEHRVPKNHPFLSSKNLMDFPHFFKPKTSRNWSIRVPSGKRLQFANLNMAQSK